MKFLPLLLSAFLSAATATSLVAADRSGDYSWRPMKIGGGGWMTGLDIPPNGNGLKYARTDVSGAYRWDVATSSWKQLVTDGSLPKEWVAYGKYGGVESIVGAPTDPRAAYMAYQGQIFRSDNHGETWLPTNFSGQQVKMEPNGEGRQDGERLAVDPANASVVYFASIADGLWTTANAGGAWERVPSVPPGTPPHGVNSVVFDKASGTIGDGAAAKTKTIYVTIFEGGVFESADAGATWIQITGKGPKKSAQIRDAEIGSDGAFYVVCDNEKGAKGSVWKYSTQGAWTDITPPAPDGESKAYWDIAIDPTSAERIAVIANGGKCFISTDQGAKWTAHDFKLQSADIRWLGVQEDYWLSVGEIAFDPAVPGKLWFAEGFGVWWADDLTTPQIVWHAASTGIEEMCGNDIIAPPGGHPVGAMWDLGAFYFEDPDAYTAQRSQPNFMSAWALDWCAADPKFIAGVFRNHLGFPPHPNSTGYSTDGGKTWTRFPAVEKSTIPAELEYGTIAVSANSPDKIVWAPVKTKLPYYTTNRGVTWKQSKFVGVTATGFGEFPTGQKPLCADHVKPDTFYFYHSEAGVFRSTDGGATFTKAGNPVSRRYNAILKAVPGHEGDLWLAEGSQEGVVGGMWQSTDGGSTWQQAPGIEQAFNFGVGKAKESDGYPTLYVAGVADGKTGIFRSTDAGLHWDNVGGYPLGIFDWVDAMDGDKEVFGKVYLTFSGAGFVFGELKPVTGLAPPGR